MIEAIRAHGRFEPPTLFTHTIGLVQGTISMGVKMGEHCASVYNYHII